MTIDELRDKVRLMDADKAIDIITEYIARHPSDDEAFLMRGLKYWGANKRALAINDYLEALRLNPDSRARQALTQANDILDFYNKDLYNP